MQEPGVKLKLSTNAAGGESYVVLRSRQVFFKGVGGLSRHCRTSLSRIKCSTAEPFPPQSFLACRPSHNQDALAINFVKRLKNELVLNAEK